MRGRTAPIKSSYAYAFGLWTPNSSVREEFIDFLECERITDAVLAGKITDALERYGLEIENVRGQGYNGLANMWFMRKGLAGGVLAENYLAIYSHCSSHKLHLAIVSCCSVSVIRHDSDMGKLAWFFNNSPKRHRLLVSTVDSECPERKKKELKDVC